MKQLFYKMISGLLRNHPVENSTNSMASAVALTPNSAVKEWTMAAALRRLSLSGFTFSTILDVGASDGKWTKDSINIFPEAQYLLFEPLEERRSELERLQSQFVNVDIELSATGASNEPVAMIVTSDLDGSRVSNNEQLGFDSRMVPSVTIDHAVRLRQLSGPFLLKLDVHGYEFPILDGAVSVLQQTRIAIIEAYNFHITANSPSFSELVAYMDKAGFYCIDIADPLRMSSDGFEWQIDLFFARKNDVFFDNISVRF